MRNETYIIYLNDGTKYPVYCKKNEIEQYITIAQYRKLDRIEQLNRGIDKVNHRPFTITL